MLEIHNCPYCKDTAHVEISGPMDSIGTHVHCMGCGCVGPYGKDTNAAVQLWNYQVRAVTAQMDQEQTRYDKHNKTLSYPFKAKDKKEDVCSQG